MVFGVGKVQMKFLHLLSTEASHSITLHCLDEPPYGTADSFSSTASIPQENATLRFRGWNKQTFEKDTLLEPHVLQDECKVMSRTSKSFSLRSTWSRIKQTLQLDVVFRAFIFLPTEILTCLDYYLTQSWPFLTYLWNVFYQFGSWVTWMMSIVPSPPPILFQIQDGSWHQSRFFFHAQDSRQLPVVDIQEYPTSQPNSQRHIEIGPVCFLWHQHHRPVKTYLHELLKCKAVTKKMAEYQRPSVRQSLSCSLETINGTC